jgi:hypothetical protein
MVSPELRETDNKMRQKGARLGDSQLARSSKSCACFALLEHVPKKLIEFLDQNMLQRFDFERFLLDPMIPSDRKAL